MKFETHPRSKEAPRGGGAGPAFRNQDYIGVDVVIHIIWSIFAVAFCRLVVALRSIRSSCHEDGFAAVMNKRALLLP